MVRGDKEDHGSGARSGARSAGGGLAVGYRRAARSCARRACPGFLAESGRSTEELAGWLARASSLDVERFPRGDPTGRAGGDLPLDPEDADTRRQGRARACSGSIGAMIPAGSAPVYLVAADPASSAKPGWLEEAVSALARLAESAPPVVVGAGGRASGLQTVPAQGAGIACQGAGASRRDSLPRARTPRRRSSNGSPRSCPKQGNVWLSRCGGWPPMGLRIRSWISTSPRPARDRNRGKRAGTERRGAVPLRAASSRSPRPRACSS